MRDMHMTLLQLMAGNGRFMMYPMKRNRHLRAMLP